MKLNIFGSLSRTGYGIATLNIAKAISKLGVNIAITPIGGAHINSEEEKVFISNAVKASKLLDYNAPCLKIWHQFDLLNRIGRGTYYAMPIFELNRFDSISKHNLMFPDEILVNSKWAADVVYNNINRKAQVVPLGIDPLIFNDTPPNTGTTYQFLNIGKWEYRKCSLLAEAFNKAFTKDDNVYLNLVPHNPFLSAEEAQKWIKSFKDTPLGDKIFILDEVNTHQDIAGLIKSCDCGIYPSHGEGWNLELLETMACNKPCIATNYSAHTEYADSNNCFLINIDRTEMAYDGKWFDGKTGEWAHLGSSQLEQCVEHMRYVYRNNIRTNPAGVETGKKYTWENSATILKEILTKDI